MRLCGELSQLGDAHRIAILRCDSVDAMPVGSQFALSLQDIGYGESNPVT